MRNDCGFPAGNLAFIKEKIKHRKRREASRSPRAAAGARLVLTSCLLCPTAEPSPRLLCRSAAVSAETRSPDRGDLSRKRRCRERAALGPPGEVGQHSFSSWLEAFWSFCLRCLPSWSQKLPEEKEPFVINSFVKNPIFFQKCSDENFLVTHTLGLTSPLFAQAGLIYFVLWCIVQLQLWVSCGSNSLMVPKIALTSGGDLQSQELPDGITAGRN